MRHKAEQALAELLPEAPRQQPALRDQQPLAQEPSLPVELPFAGPEPLPQEAELTLPEPSTPSAARAHSR